MPAFCCAYSLARADRQAYARKESLWQKAELSIAERTSLASAIADAAYVRVDKPHFVSAADSVTVEFAACGIRDPTSYPRATVVLFEAQDRTTQRCV